MTIQERIAWAKRLTIIQIVITLALFGGILFLILLGTGVASFMTFGVSRALGNLLPLGGIAFGFFLVALFLCLILPVITLIALNQAGKGPWGIVAYACLILSLIVGNFTPLSLLPLATIIFLIDGPTFRYMTGDKDEKIPPMTPPTVTPSATEAPPQAS